MSLPILTSEEDLQALVDYLKTKATGASIEEAKSVIDKKILDPRKITGYTTWGFVIKEGERIKLDTLGRELSRANQDNKHQVYVKSIKRVKAYHTSLEWMFHQSFETVTNVEVAAHWHEYNKTDLGTDNENTIKDMAVCFFRLCDAAGLGKLVIGRQGQSTRFEINKGALGQYIGEEALNPIEEYQETYSNEEIKKELELRKTLTVQEIVKEDITYGKNEIPRIFISHSKNMEIVEQIKTMLDLADLVYEIAEEEETAAIPVPEKVFSAMRKSSSAVICVTADENEKKEDGTYGINQNVLIEIGAAFVLYDKKVILVWDKRLAIPSNLQGLYRCEFVGDELSWSTGMKLMKALTNFKKL